MSDSITLSGVRAFGYHGVLAPERREGQVFVVDVCLRLDVTVAAGTDDVADTVNYAEVAADIVAILQGPPRDLIETVVCEIADTVLRRYELLERVDVTLHKPQAPVGVPFGDVSIQVARRRDVPVVIALGANLGEAVGTVRRAISQLDGIPGVWGVRPSPLYRTAAVGGPDQDDYVNAVVLARTALSPARLLRALHEIEALAGRTRSVRWGPRTLDLDLIQYGDPVDDTEVRCQDGDLILPHPRAHERAFVLVPWSAIDPDAHVSIESQSVPVAQRLDQVGTEGVSEIETGS